MILPMSETLSAHIIEGIGGVPKEDWDGLLGEDPSPFLRWDWLNLLEVTGCAVESAGWLPHHVIVSRGEQLVAACPIYLKLNSMGEFVFDHDWAIYAERLGVDYYPKLLIGAICGFVRHTTQASVFATDSLEIFECMSSVMPTGTSGPTISRTDAVNAASMSGNSSETAAP